MRVAAVVREALPFELDTAAAAQVVPVELVHLGAAGAGDGVVLDRVPGAVEVAVEPRRAAALRVDQDVGEQARGFGRAIERAVVGDDLVQFGQHGGFERNVQRHVAFLLDELSAPNLAVSVGERGLVGAIEQELHRDQLGLGELDQALGALAGRIWHGGWRSTRAARGRCAAGCARWYR